MDGDVVDAINKIITTLNLARTAQSDMLEVVKILRGQIDDLKARVGILEGRY